MNVVMITTVFIITVTFGAVKRNCCKRNGGCSICSPITIIARYFYLLILNNVKMCIMLVMIFNTAAITTANTTTNTTDGSTFSSIT